jgi:methylenetetrahydrofolate reductase (NADPH)
MPDVSTVGLKQQVMDFVRHASQEVTTHDEKCLPQLVDLLPRGATVYVAHTPKVSFHDVILMSTRVQSLGLKASPHLVARRIPSADELRGGLQQLRESGVQQALLVAGDGDVPLGPYTSSLDVIESDVLADSGLARLGVGGHPEGHPTAESAALWQALRAKQAFAARTGILLHVTTQFGFDPQRIHAWAAEFDREDLQLPIHVGLAGPTSLTKLLRFAVQCGVRASLQAASKNVEAMSNVARAATSPEDMVSMLVKLGAGSESSRIVQPHFFTFGGAVSTAKWIREVSTGAFDVRPNGRIVIRS